MDIPGDHPSSEDFWAQLRSSLPDPFATFLVGLCCGSAAHWPEGGLSVQEVSTGQEISWRKGLPSSERKINEFFSCAFGNLDLKAAARAEIVRRNFLNALRQSFKLADFHLEVDFIQEGWCHELHLLITSTTVDRLYVRLFWSID
jgi:hypothetical protein